MADIDSDLPRVKKVKIKGDKPEKAAPAKSEKKDKKEKKAEKPKKEKAPKKGKEKAEKPKKEKKEKPAKAAKASKKEAKAAAKTAAKAAKPAKPAKGAAKGGAVKGSADQIANALVVALTKKVEPVKLDVTNAKSVETNLIVATVSAVQKKYSDRVIASVNHENDLIKKGLKGILTKNASGLRNDILASKSKKIGGIIFGAIKASVSGKLDAAGYKAAVAKINEAL